MAFEQEGEAFPERKQQNGWPGSGLMKRSAQKLRKVLDHGEQELDQAAEDVQENREMLFRQQMDPFRSYVDSDGERHRQIQSQMELSAANGVRLRETEEIVDRLKQEYEEREQQRDEGRRRRGKTVSFRGMGALEWLWKRSFHHPEGKKG